MSVGEKTQFRAYFSNVRAIRDPDIRCVDFNMLVRARSENEARERLLKSFCKYSFELDIVSENTINIAR